MRLVLQCSVCGTIHTVGTAICGTCRASGIQNLRLLFECLKCFRLGLNPSCEICSNLLSLDPDEALPEANLSLNLVGVSGDMPALVAEFVGESEPSREILEATLEEETIEESRLDRAPKDDSAEDDSDFELTPDDLPIAELSEEELHLDDGHDSIVEDK